MLKCYEFMLKRHGFNVETHEFMLKLASFVSLSSHWRYLPRVVEHYIHSVIKTWIYVESHEFMLNTVNLCWKSPVCGVRKDGIHSVCSRGATCDRCWYAGKKFSDHMILCWNFMDFMLKLTNLCWHFMDFMLKLTYLCWNPITLCWNWVRTDAYESEK